MYVTDGFIQYEHIGSLASDALTGARRSAVANKAAMIRLSFILTPIKINIFTISSVIVGIDNFRFRYTICLFD